MSLLPILTVFSLWSAPTQESRPAPDAQRAPAVSTPIYPNASCPIMGKPISTRLYTDTEKGRIWICCKGCVKDILADVATAYRTAYPADKKLENKLCPVSGLQIEKDAPTVVLQGFQFYVRGKAEVALAREQAQIVLAKLNDPKLVDLENQTCPVTGEAAAKNTFVVIAGTIVRLASAKAAEEAAKDPAKVLAKAKELRAKEQAAAPKR